ncbi:MAG: chloride channel protein, partial [Bdellovibrionales bacterium]|nr:chloride channel protein [Bdellovibrionales bacterium]
MTQFFSKSRTARMVALSVTLGVFGALVSQLFMILIEFATRLFLGELAGYQPATTALEGGLEARSGAFGLYLIPLATTIGGLISGLLVCRFAPEAEGHGTDAAIRSYHRLGGSIRPRVPLVKALASAATIGSGGSAGREGPIAQIAAGLGSFIGTKLKLSVPDRRVVMLTGIAAGISASFKSPLGAALFTVEVLYGGLEFETGVLAFCVIASSVAYAVNGFFSGWIPIFQIPPDLAFTRSTDLFWFAMLGVICGISGSLLPTLFYRFNQYFKELSIYP